MRNEPPHADLILPTVPLVAQPLVCHRCGGAIQPPKLDCVDCLKLAYRKAMLGRQREIVFARPHIKFALARDVRTRVAHVAMFGDHRLMFCGKKVTQPKYQREEQTIADFPPGVCEQCVMVLQETLSP